MHRRSTGLPLWLALPLCTALCGCGEEQGVSYPVFDEPELNLGREIWLANCQSCHGTGLAGAPRLGNEEAWAPRIRQGIDVLFSHALTASRASPARKCRRAAATRSLAMPP